jgi:hypothetical protein
VTLRLESDGLDPYDLDGDDQVVVTNWELTPPEVRAVLEARPGDDGETDRSRFFSGRAFTITGAVFAGDRSQQRILDQLAAFCHPSARPYIYYSIDDGSLRRVALRVTDPPASANDDTDVRSFAVAWRCPAFAESADPIAPAVAAGGFSFPFSFPLVFPAGGGGAVTVDNPGNMPAQWVARIFGPCDDPVLTNQRTGETVGFNGLTVAAGDYVEIDSTNHTVHVNGLASASRYHLLDLASLSWFRIEPGSNSIAFTATTPGATSQAELTFRSTYL